MEKWINKKLKISLPNGYYYKGKCIEHEGDMITILDLKGNEVMLNLLQIATLEVLDHGDT